MDIVHTEATYFEIQDQVKKMAAKFSKRDAFILMEIFEKKVWFLESTFQLPHLTNIHAELLCWFWEWLW